jgi:hypothetical protein
MPQITIGTSKTFEVTEEFAANLEQDLLWGDADKPQKTAPPKPLAQQIREQLEAEGMTVKRILGNNVSMCCSPNSTANRLTPIEATRRRVERAAEIVRERVPYPEDIRYYSACYQNGTFSVYWHSAAKVGGLQMQSTEQWNLLREVIGDEELKELIQK